MLHEASDIATSTPDPFDGGCPADTEQRLAATGPAISVYDQLRADNARLTAIESQLRSSIREANHKIERMLAEIDIMVAKLQGVAK